MTVEIDNAILKNGELVYFSCNTEVINNVLHVRITKNNRYIAIKTKEHTGLNCILVDMLKFNVSILPNDKNWK